MENRAIKRKELPRCPTCDVKPRWGWHYCACPKCGQGVYGTRSVTRQSVAQSWIKFVMDHYRLLLELAAKEKSNE